MLEIDTTQDIGSNIRHFAYNFDISHISLYMVVKNPETTAELLNSDIDKILKWAKRWLVTFNPIKTETLSSTQQTISSFFIYG